MTEHPYGASCVFDDDKCQTHGGESCGIDLMCTIGAYEILSPVRRGRIQAIVWSEYMTQTQAERMGEG